MKYWIPILGIAALCASCVQNCRDTTLYQRTGRQKAIVAVLPFIDHTSEHHFSWDLAREFTDEVRKRVFDSNKIYLLRDAGSFELAKQFNTPDPKTIPESAFKELGASEFVVVGELIDQKQIPYGLPKSRDNSSLEEVGAVLSLALRVRVIDVRHEKPKIILQEILNHEHVVARAYINTDYSKAPWGSEAFERTPMGIAHNRLVRELLARVEAYVETVR